MLGELLVLVVLTVVRVFLPNYMDCLEKRCVLMTGGCLFDYVLCFWRFLRYCWRGLMWGLLISILGNI